MQCAAPPESLGKFRARSMLLRVCVCERLKARHTLVHQLLWFLERQRRHVTKHPLSAMKSPSVLDYLLGIACNDRGIQLQGLLHQADTFLPATRGRIRKKLEDQVRSRTVIDRTEDHAAVGQPGPYQEVLREVACGPLE